MFELSDLEIKKLREQDSRLVSDFQARKLEVSAQKFWDQFYKRNKTKFFKDRHWTSSEFQELLDENINNVCTNILEVGCGVGNLIYPLLEKNKNLNIFACDFSPRAVEFVKSHPLYNSEKIIVFQADVIKDDLLQCTKTLVDIVTVVFFLSALHPKYFSISIKNIFKVLKPGGKVLFRDYGMYDMTQLRFKPGHKIADNFYMRQDGTTTYFFTVEQVKKLFTDEGFEELVCHYIESRTINKKENIDVPRTFVQAKFIKKS